MGSMFWFRRVAYFFLPVERWRPCSCWPDGQPSMFGRCRERQICRYYLEFLRRLLTRRLALPLAMRSMAIAMEILIKGQFITERYPDSPPCSIKSIWVPVPYIDRVQLLRCTDTDATPDGPQRVFGHMSLTIYQDDGTGHPGNVGLHARLSSELLRGQARGATTDPGFHGCRWDSRRHVRTICAIGTSRQQLLAHVLRVRSDWRETHAGLYRGQQHRCRQTRDNLLCPWLRCVDTSGNDGNIDGSFGSGIYRPVYHSSNFGVGEYWQVDLARVHSSTICSYCPRRRILNLSIQSHRVWVRRCDGCRQLYRRQR